MENNLFRNVRKTKKSFTDGENRYNETKAKLMAELEYVRKLEEEVKAKYLPTLSTISANNELLSSDLKTACGMVFHYGQFDNTHILDLLATFLTYVEGEKFVPCSDVRNYPLRPIWIIKESVQKMLHDEEFIKKLCERGYIIEINSKVIDRNKICFYDESGNANFKVGKYGYLAELINMLIQYRYENGLYSSIYFEHFNECVNTLLENHPELMTKNQERKEKLFSEVISDENDKEFEVFEQKYMSTLLKKRLSK